MKARIHCTCLPRSKRASYEAEDIHIDVELPFTPFPGLLLKVTAGGDYLKVHEVYLDLTPGGEGFNVFIEEPDELSELWKWSDMRAQGWRLG